MYDHSSVTIVVLLFVALLAATEIGYRIGQRFFSSMAEPAKSQISSIQASILGVLALLLGFTFSLALQRYDARSEAVVNEANAIGTAMLRSGLLPGSVRQDAQVALDGYLDARINAGLISLDQSADRDALLQESEELFATLWRIAEQAASEDPSPVKSGLFIQALNDMIDAYGSRDAALNRHVPELVLFLMFATLILAATLIGYASGVSGHRTSFAAYSLFSLIILLVFVVIDLDRPRRGLIEVSQQSLLALRPAP
jgi:hypothetical protein